MKNEMKVAIVAMLIGAAAFGRQVHGLSPWSDSILLGLLLFGILNVVLSLPGTHWPRTVALVATFPALLWGNQGWRVVLLLLVPLVWFPAFMVSWALALPPDDGTGGEQQRGHSDGADARVVLASLIAAVTIGSLVYRELVLSNLQQTAGLFIGIPALLAVIVTFGVSPRSAIGVATKAVTIGLFVSMLFLGEGIVCVVMSAPLFYAIAIVIGSTMDVARKRQEAGGTTLMSCLVVLVMVPLSLEGITGATTFNRDESVSATRIVQASSPDVARALVETPRFNRVEPLYLRAGFPSPTSLRTEQQGGAARWIVQFRGGEMRLNGMEARTGDLVLEVEESRPGLIRWRAVSDTSHMTHFLDWHASVVQWEAVDAHTTRVTWTLRYRRWLDPAWYFGPMERYAMRLAAGYLIDSVATP